MSRFARRNAPTAPGPKGGKLPKGPVAGVPVASNAPAPIRVLLPATNFDLLQGTYAKVLRTRLVLLVVGLVVGVAIIGMVYVGGSAANDASSLNATTAQIKAGTANAVRQLGAATAYNGISGNVLKAHVSVRSASVRGALGTQVDVAQLLADVQAISAGTLTSFTVGTPPSTSATAVAPPTTVAPSATTAPGCEPTTKGSGPALQVTITASVPTFQAAGTYISQSKALPALIDVCANYTGSEPAVTVTVTGTTSNLPLTVPAAATAPAKGA